MKPYRRFRVTVWLRIDHGLFMDRTAACAKRCVAALYGGSKYKKVLKVVAKEVMS